MTHNGEMAPTAKLRFVERRPPSDPVDGPAGGPPRRILQQWWAPSVPSYMVDPSQGQWVDVPLGIESP